MTDRGLGHPDEQSCPFCGKPLQPRLPLMPWNMCFNCGHSCDDEGNCMDDVIESFQKDMQSYYDEFVTKLFQQTYLHLDDEAEDSPGFSLRQFLQRIDPTSNSDPLVRAVVVNLVNAARQYQLSQRPSLDTLEVVDGTRPFGKLTQAFVIDFISQCRQRLATLTDAERQMLAGTTGSDHSDDKSLSGNSLEMTQVLIKLMTGPGKGRFRTREP
jgi:hypothetical protein